eukprot:5045126-Pyramimonas_sp.AAC.1
MACGHFDLMFCSAPPVLGMKRGADEGPVGKIKQKMRIDGMRRRWGHEENSVRYEAEEGRGGGG